MSTDNSADEPFRTPYPDYDVLDKWDSPSFNDQTRRVVADRLRNVPERRFFDPDEYALLRAVIDCILPQPERSEAERIPVEAFLDAKLESNKSEGTHIAGTPPMRESWRRGLKAVDEEAKRRHGHGFRELSPQDQHALFKAIDAEEDIDKSVWGDDLSPRRFFREVLLRHSVKIYYAHPYAWNEIGFGGPASPRGYLRLGPDARDPWEAQEILVPQKVGNLP